MTLTPQATQARPDEVDQTKSAPRARVGFGRRRSSRINRPHPALFLFPLPALALYIVFFAMPTFEAVRYAITDWDGFSPDYNDVGLSNFTTIATADNLFRNALFNNIKFMLVVVVFQTLLSLVLAVFLVKNTRSSVFLRSVYFFPTILSSVSVAFIWKFVYDPNYGLANTVLGAVGLDGLQSAFLGDDGKAIYFVAATQVWFHVGQMMVIYVAGLQQIPAELYEAAEVDGATRWQLFRHVTWPMVAPATAIVIAYTTVQSFKAFDLILGLGGNPPKPSLDILSTRIYAGFANSEFGYAAAESIVFMFVIALVTWLQRRAVRVSQGSA
jgi:raffinose/stachyose/melibiose transport system permease protein